MANKFYNSLSNKYYWRDWLVVVYPEMRGSDNHYRRYCYDGVTTANLKHWKKRYNILISSISADTKDQAFTTTENIQTFSTKWVNNNPGRVMKKVPWDAKKIYENLPSGMKKCKYPIAGVVDNRGNFVIRAPENRKFHLVKKNSAEYFNIFALG